MIKKSIAKENIVNIQTDMARIFITGSADGLGNMTARQLVNQGHKVVLHARNEERAQDAMLSIPGAENALSADLSNMEETKKLAENVNALGVFDTVIHNAGVYKATNNVIFKVNTLAPYILTCLIKKPKRLIYISSGLHLQGNPDLNDSTFGNTSYSDSKLYLLMLTFAVARKWTDVYTNAINPGWVPTKMGGLNAPDDLQKGIETQVWLAVSNEKKAKVNGHYFFHQNEKYSAPVAGDHSVQEKFLALCEHTTGIPFPIS